MKLQHSLITALFTCSAIGASASGGRGYTPPPPPSSGDESPVSADYTADASGLQSGNRTQISGFIVRGYGATQDQADADAMARCQLIGFSCKLR